MITGILLQQVNFTWALFTALLLETLLQNFSLKSHSCSTFSFLFFPPYSLHHLRAENLFESGLAVISATMKRQSRSQISQGLEQDSVKRCRTIPAGSNLCKFQRLTQLSGTVDLEDHSMLQAKLEKCLFHWISHFSNWSRSIKHQNWDNSPLGDSMALLCAAGIQFRQKQTEQITKERNIWKLGIQRYYTSHFHGRSVSGCFQKPHQLWGRDSNVNKKKQQLNSWIKSLRLSKGGWTSHSQTESQ